MTDLASVWTWQAFGAAVVVGILLGYAIMPRGVQRAMRPVLVQLLGPAAGTRVLPYMVRATSVATFVMGEILGAGFYVGQTVVEFQSGSDLWPRVLARSVVFAMYIAALAIGVGLWARRHQPKAPQS